MLSDEEKKAIERIDYIQDFIIENGQYNADVNDMEYFSRILNLIEKQQKEIEILNKNMNLLREQNISYKQSIHGLKEMNKIINKKWEDEIKAKIEELEKQQKEEPDAYLCIKVLQSLLKKE